MGSSLPCPPCPLRPKNQHFTKENRPFLQREFLGDFFLCWRLLGRLKKGKNEKEKEKEKQKKRQKHWKNNSKTRKRKKGRRTPNKKKKKKGKLKWFAVVVETFFNEFLDDFHDFVFGMCFPKENQQPILGLTVVPKKSDNVHWT